MGFYYWFRVAMMIVSFVVVVATIRSMNSGKPVASPILNILGIQPGGQNGGVHEQVTLCPTRVVSLESSDGTLLREAGMKWFREVKGEDQVQLDTVAVEKWFSHHCTVAAQSVASTETAVDKGWTFTYVNGQNAILAGVAGQPGVYRFGNQTFRSQQLDEALHTFSALPAQKPPGQ